MTELTLPGTSPFDAIRREHDGHEYWSGRDLMPLLGYEKWERFEDSIDRARHACRASGHEPADHFPAAGKKVQIGSGAERTVRDFHLTRFAAYLVAMNGDPRKPEVAAAQAYFAVKTREAEVARPMTREELLSRAVLEATAALAEKDQRIAELEGPAESWQHFASTDGDLSVNEAAKVLSRHPGIAIGERRLWTWLDEHRWTYRDGAGDRRAYQARIDSGHLTTRARGHHHPSTGEWVIDAPQVRVSMKGIELIRRHMVGAIKAVAS